MAGRFANVAPVGSLLKQPTTAKRRPAVKPQVRARDSGHLDAIRQLPCINPRCRRDPAGVAAHVRFACSAVGKPQTGMQTKPDDAWTLPLCPSCHTDAPDAQHKGNEVAFWQRLGIDPLKIATALYDASPNVEHMRSVIYVSHTISTIES